jgi:hypothetical protein
MIGSVWNTTQPLGYASRRAPVEFRVCRLGKEAGGCSSAPPKPVESIVVNS